MGCDGLCTRYNAYLSMKSAFESQNRKFEMMENPIDKGILQDARQNCYFLSLAWADRPSRPENSLEIRPLSTSGQSWQDKVAATRAEIKAAGCQGLIVTMLDEVAWLFNLRGTDIPFNPLFFSYCYVGLDTIKLFMNPKQATSDVRAHLEGVEICNYGDTMSFLQRFSCNKNSIDLTRII